MSVRLRSKKVFIFLRNDDFMSKIKSSVKKTMKSSPGTGAFNALNIEINVYYIAVK